MGKKRAQIIHEVERISMSNIHFGMPTLIEHNSVEESVRFCVDKELDFIELNMNLPAYQADKIDIQKLIELKENKIYFTIHLDENFNIWDFNPFISNAYLETLKVTIELAVKIGVPIINMHINSGVYFTLPTEKIYLYERYSEHYHYKTEQLRDVCEKMIDNENIKICVENTDGFAKYQRTAIEYLLESKVFGLTMDVGHSNSCGKVDEEFILSHKDKLSHMHIHDAIGKKNHMPLGDGEIDIKSSLVLAKETNSRCVIETKTITGLEKSISFLRNIEGD